MEANLGIKGATYQSWHGDAIRVVFREIQQEHPRADEKRLIKLLTERISEETEVAKAAAEYIVKNMLGTQRGYAQPTTEERAQRQTEIDEAVKVGVNKILLLNYPMPNGQRLRYCTGTYLVKLGGAFARVGKKAGTKYIGEVFDENTLRECMGVDVEQ